MKKHSGTILLVLIFFVGLAVMLYPTISDYINQRNQTRVVNSYAQQVDGLSDADYTAYFDAADVFNQEIAAAPDALYHADRFSTYSTTLDVTGTGIMGYITIPRIGWSCPSITAPATPCCRWRQAIWKAPACRWAARAPMR